MNCIYFVILILICAIFYFCRETKHEAIEAFESVESTPIEDKIKYKDEIDYYITPITQAIRMENALSNNKHQIYNKYNEAVHRYNKVAPKVKKHPKVPNIETVVRNRDRVFREIINTAPAPAPAPAPMPVLILPPVPIKKDPKRKDRLKIEIKSSAQNVHDHNVNDELSARYNGLKISNLADDSSKSYLEMLDFINKHDQSKRKIINGFDVGEPISRFNDDNEATIWMTVWRRIHSTDNKDNVDDLKNSLADAIKDCTEDGELVCTTGRVTRALNSLTLMDSNEKIASPIKTDDMERKEVYDKAYKILQEELNKKSKGFKDKYESGEMDDAESDLFDTKVKDRIKKDIGEDSPYIKDALAAI